MMAENIFQKKLIEVALPLPEINDASAYDKMPGIGPHPKGIHHWWARLPLPTARAVLFASVVTDPSDDPAWRDKGEQEQDAERERLFGIIRRMMGKKLHEHPEVYAEAQAEMLKHCEDKLPPVLDPFSGGGSIPLEAARLGFEAHAADLNPVAVLLNKCNLELAPRWSNHPPVNPKDVGDYTPYHTWIGTHGLAADVRYYGRLIRQRAQEKIGHLYPKVRLPKENGGGEANVIAWLWARTVASQDPAAKGAHVPLVSSYWLSTKGKSQAWLEPVVDRAAGTYRFEVKTGTPKDKAVVKAGTKLCRGAKFMCVLSGQPIDEKYVKAEGLARRHKTALICTVAEGPRGRIYVSPSQEHENAARVENPDWNPDGGIPERLTGGTCFGYGIQKWGEAFSPRQLTALTFLSDAVREIRGEIVKDFLALDHAAAKTFRPGEKDSKGCSDADAYATAVCTFLALAVDRTADFNNSLCRWSSSNQKVMNLFGKQAIPMVWDFAEANTLGDSVGAWSTCAEYVADCVEVLGASGGARGHVNQHDAAQTAGATPLMVSTDPPYYDNIGYAALSDFFYVWLRRTIGDLYRPLCDTVLVPKMPELTASPERFEGDKEKAKEHFESGFRRTFTHLRERLDPRFPLTVYYAFKQDDEESGGDAGEAPNGSVDLTTGWETLLDALISSGFTITATCPVRASQAWRMVSMGTNALASYIVLACRPRTEDKRTGRAAFIAELKRELPAALRHLQQGNVAPVDFAQAAIGPGMAVFSRYSAVLESNGKPMSVRTALALINGIKDELLGEAVEELDKDTRWATTWFSETGFEWGEAGKANLLATARGTAMNSLIACGIVATQGNQVRLYRPEELPADWNPETDKRLTVWEMTHHLIRVYVHEKKGDPATAGLLRQLGSKAEVARDLAYRLFTVCESKKRSQEAQAYNALVMGWPELARLARESASRPQAPVQGELL
jgi:putative DNA methylase